MSAPELTTRSGDFTPVVYDSLASGLAKSSNGVVIDLAHAYRRAIKHLLNNDTVTALKLGTGRDNHEGSSVPGIG